MVTIYETNPIHKPRSMFIQRDEISSCFAVNAYICGLSFQYNIDLSLNSSTITVMLVVVISG